MRPSGVASERPMTFVVCLVALGFLVILAGGPSEFVLTVQQTIRSVAATVVQFVQHPRA